MGTSLHAIVETSADRGTTWVFHSIHDFGKDYELMIALSEEECAGVWTKPYVVERPPLSPEQESARVTANAKLGLTDTIPRADTTVYHGPDCTALVHDGWPGVPDYEHLHVSPKAQRMHDRGAADVDMQWMMVSNLNIVLAKHGLVSRDETFLADIPDKTWARLLFYSSKSWTNGSRMPTPCGT